MRSRRLLAVAVLAVAALLVAFQLRPRVPGPPGPAMRDFEAYDAAGATYDRGADPYSRALWTAERTIPGVDPRRLELLPYVGPSAALPLFGLLARLPYDTATRAWGACLALALGAALFGMRRLFAAPRTWATLAGMLLLAATFGPLTSDVALGQAALVAFAAVVVSLVALEARLTACAAAAAVCATIQPNLVLVLAARLRERRSVVAYVAGALAFAALVLALGGGPAGFARYLALLRAHGAAERALAIQITPPAIAWELGASAHGAVLAGAAVALGAFVLALASLRATRDPLAAVAIGCVALPFVVPFFHEHDFVVALFPAFLLAVRARGAALALAALGTTAVAIDWLGFGQRPTGILQSLALAAAAALAFALLAHARERAALAGLAVVAAAIPLALFARAHPVPIWPDALPPAFAVPVALNASAVWHAEQAAAGLERQTPAWAVLKACTLAGCALLWTAVVLDARRAPRTAPTSAAGDSARR